MDIQIKRGILEICVLKALEEKDSYGYKIIKDIHPYMDISESTLYPILRRLEAGNCLEVYSAEHNGRLRKYYHITQEGKQRIQVFLDEWKEVMEVYQFIKNGGKETDYDQK